MATNIKHCLLLLSVVLVLIMGLGLVSATDANNTTQVIKDNNVLSTPSNYDVDNVVQSDLVNVKSDADVEKISNTSKNTNTITTNKQTENTEITTNYNITTSNITKTDIQKILKGEGEKTFTQLQTLIDESTGVLTLYDDYKYDTLTDNNDGITITKSITIEGNGHVINGNNLSRIFIVTADNVALQNITFINAYSADNGGAILWGGQNGLINNSTFYNNTAALGGGAIFLVQSNNVTINNSIFTKNIAHANGGAVMADVFSKYTKILNSNFTNNSVPGYNLTNQGTNHNQTWYYGDGGAIFFGEGSSNGWIDNSTFINNSVNANGGAVVWNGEYLNITSSRFYNNSAPYAAGAVRLNGKYLVVNDTLFDGNYDPIGNYSWGSAIYLTGNYTNITNSNFTNHKGSNTGGAIAIDGSNEILDNNIFKNNSAYNGGAVFIQKNENVIFNNTNFINNTATLGGGAINIDSYANNTKISNSNFTNNRVTGYTDSNGWLYGEGGAVNFGQGCFDGIIENSTFTNNTAFSKAGAVNWNGDNGQIISSNFTKNTASLDGGAVLFTGNKGYINTSIFKNNTSNYAGGALRISGNNTTVNNTLFDGNYDPQKKAWGSAIYLSGHNAMIVYSNFTNNYGSVSAGALYVAGTNTTVSYSQFENNNATKDAGAVLLNGTNGSILYSNFTNNTAGNGGGAVYVNGSFSNISNSHFIQNNAKLNAGAIFINGNNATITESNITDNKVTSGLGGAIYVSGNNASISYTNFSRNNASSDGGAIYIKGTKTTFEYCNMTYNWANGKGGVIYNNGVNASILYSNFEHNYAKNDGGCMDLTGSSNSVIIGCNFTNGTTNEHGGAISATNSNNLTIQSSRFVNCSNGNTHGGAIYLEGNSVDSNLLVDNCTFINDTSGKDAGAIYFQNQNGKNSTLSNCTFINCTTSIRSPGAVCWRENNGLIINNVFINCTAMSMDSTQYSGQGGAMYLENAVNNVLINDTFINCSAVWDGGAIYYRANSRNNTHINCTFINNTAGRNGGALYFLNANNTYDGCVFINNTAERGGSIYYSVNDGIIMRNCVFENNSDVTEGGFIYISGKNLNIDNTTFHNGLAEKGGALYVTQDVNITNSNITNNNATTGSAIYLKSGNVRLTNVNLLENQAHSKEFANTYNYVENGERVIGGQFTGYDNLLNGIYREGGNVICVNVKYLGVDGIVNSDDTQDTMLITINEIYQKVIIEVYDKDNNLFYEAINMTDKDGKYEFRFTDSEDYSYRLYHPEDEYYTYLVYALNKMIVNMTVTTSNITYGESESIQIKIFSDNNVIPTGRVTVYVNSTLGGFENRTFTATLDETGIIIIDDAPLDMLNASSYDVYVNYTGDINYFSEQESTLFNVSKKATIVDYDVEDYTYNQTRLITVSLTDIEGTLLSGKVLLNITGALFNGTKISINDIPLNIEVGDEGQITGNTYNLPILDAGNYEITAFYNETSNYYQNTTVKRFTVNKATPTVNLTAKADNDEIFGIYVHVEPEIATNRVTVTITNQTGMVDQFILTLNDSKASKILDVLPVGHYEVSTYYIGDNNHYELTNTTSFDVTIENYPIDIQLRNMTYGQTQIIQVTVPNDGVIDNLSIKLNGEDITFTMNEDGLIQIDTQSLTDIVPDGKLVVGEYNLSVSYTTDGHYRSNSSSLLFNVTKADPTVNLETRPISYGDNETVTLTLNSYNATGNITVKLINSEDVVIDTREYDINSNTPVEFNYTELQSGTYKINVSYVNDTNYNNVNVTGEFTVNRQLITINELSDIYVGESQRIWGIVTDGYGLAVTKGNVNITLSNGTNITCSVDSSGVYSSEPIFINNGTYIVTASYIYNDIVRQTSVERSFNVLRIPTVTTVQILNNTVGHVSIDVIVRENIPGKYTGYIQDGVVNVTIPGINNGNPVQYPINGINTTIPLNDITWVGTIPVSVVYNGTSKYESSTGLNISNTSQTFNHIDVEAITSNMTITVEPNPVVSGTTVTISGRVYDESGLEITDGTVDIKVGDITYSNVEVTSNGYSHEYITSIVGQIPVEVHFNGLKDGQSHDVVLESTNNTTFTVEVNKRKTNLTIIPFTDVEINKTFTITLNLTNRTGDPIKDKTINVLINKNPVTVSGVTGNDGLLSFDYVVHNNNPILVEAEFIEDEEYLGNSTYLLYVEPIPLLGSNISVEVANNHIHVDENIEISGSLNDSNNNPIKQADVIIKINNIEVTTVTTDSNGEYTFVLSKDNENYREYLQYAATPYSVTAVYVGAPDVILGNASTTVYNVEKTPTEITFSDVESTVNEEFTVEVTLTNATGDKKAIQGKTVKVNLTINGQTTEYKVGGLDPVTDEDGKVYVTYTPVDNSTIIITALYDGDEIFNGTQNTTTVEVSLMKSTITVRVEPESVVLTDKVTIIGSLVNNTAGDLEGETVIVTVDTDEYTAIVDNEGNFRIENVVAQKAGTITVIAAYDGIENILDSDTDECTFEVTKIPTLVTIEDVEDVEVNKPFDIVITLTNTTNDNDPINGKSVKVTVNGETIEDVPVTDSNGQIIISYTPTDTDDIIVTAEFEGDEEYLPSQTATKTITDISLSIPVITVDINETVLARADSVNITGTLVDGQGNPVPDADIVLVINDTFVISGVKTDANGNYYSIQENLVPGTYTVTARYEGLENVYDESNTASCVYVVNDYTITINIDKNIIYVGENISIQGTVTDGRGKLVKDGIVVVTLDNGIQYTYTINSTTGLYGQSQKYDAVGHYIANASYIIDSNTNITSNNVQFEVIRIPTTTTIRVVNQTAGNVTVEVTVINQTGLSVEIGNVTVEFDDETIIALKNLTNGKVNITIPSSDDSTLNIKVIYNQNDKYLESTETAEITVAKQDANIDISVNPTELFIGEEVTINVNVTDGMENQITDKNQVDIYINNVAISKDLIDVTDGNFTVTLTTTSNGTFTVNASYKGNDTVNAKDSDSIQYVVNKIPTMTNVTILNSSYGNITIRVNVTDQRNPNEFVTTGFVYVYDFITGNLLVQEANVAGTNVDLKLNIESNKTKLLVYYQENSKYLSSNARNESAFALDQDVIVINVDKVPSITNIEKILSNKSGNVTLAINVTDENEDLISNGHVIVTNATDGSILGEGNLVDGKVNITLADVTEPGDIMVNVSFEGNDHYLASNATGLNAPEDMPNTTVITVTVDPEITISLDKTEAIVGEVVRISGTVYNNTHEPLLEDTNIKVTINGTDYPATFNSEDGTYYYDYTPSYNGTVTINASIIKDDEVVLTSDSLELTINKVPTIVKITDITYVEVNKEFTIEVTLTDNTTAIESANIEIYVNGQNLTGIAATNSSGMTSITYTPTNNTPLEIRAVYAGSEVYLSNEDTTTLTVDTLYSILKVNVNKSSLYAGESINISGVLVDSQANKIVDASISLYVNGNYLTSVPTVINGEYSYVINHLTEGEYNVRAVYDGIANAITGDEDITYYSVHKMPTSLALVVPEEAEVLESFDIEATLLNATSNTNALTGKSITITVNGVPITSVPVTDSDGKVKVSYTPQNNTILVIQAVFSEDDYYVGSSDTKTITSNNIALSPSSINVSVNKSSLYAGESINITGRLVDGQDNIIKSSEVLIYINGELNATVYTNRSGEYNYVLNDLKKGDYTVKVVYEGVENVINASENDTTFTVDKMPTTLTLEVPEEVTVYVPFDIEVTLVNATDNTNPIAGKDVVITVNDVELRGLTDGEGKVVVSYTPQDNSSLVIKAVFAEDTYYYGDEDTTTINSQNIVLSKSNINVTVNKTSLYTGESINITGRLADGTGNIITDADVKIYINDEYKTTVQTNSTGQYTYSIDDLKKGDYTVKVVYDGKENVIKESENETTYNVDKMPTTLTIVVPGSVEVRKGFDIEVTLVNATDNTNPIAGKDVVITVNDVELGGVTDGEGKVVVSYTPQDNSSLVIKAVFAEDTYYYGDEDTVTINGEDILLSQSHLTVDVNESALGYFDSVNISGKLTDGQDNPIADASLTIRIINATSGEVIKEVTDKATDNNGEYSLVLDNLEVGDYIVNASYAGLENAIINSSANTTFNVSDYSLTVNIDRPEIYYGEYVTIFGTVYNGRGEIVKSGNVNVKIYNTTGLYTEYDDTIVEGVYSTNLQYNAAQNYTAVVTYTVNDEHSVSNTSIEYVVNKIPTITNVTILNNTVGNVTIDVVVKEDVTDKYTNTLTEGTISITINGTTVNYPISGYNTTIYLADIYTTEDISVSVIYNGSDKYEASTGIDNNTGNTIANITSSPVASNITITVTNPSVLVGQQVIITGQVIDDVGNVIKTGTVHINIDGEHFEDAIIDETTGYYTSTEYTTIHNGIIDVNVSYDGQMTQSDNPKELILASANSTTFNVDKIPTTTTVEVLDNTVGNVLIDIKVVGQDGNNTLTGKVNITLSGKSFTKDLVEGQVNLTVKLSNITTIGDYSLTVSYLGNENYTNSTGLNTSGDVFENITVKKQTATLTVAVNNSSIYLHESVDITGVLLDEFNNPLNDSIITLNVNGKDYIVKTNSTGGYNMTYKADTLGQINVNATFDDINYNNITVNDTFNVGKIPTKTSVEILNTTLSNVTIAVEVVDVYGNNIPNGTVKVHNASDYTQILTQADITDGIVNITIDSDKIGELNITVEYVENEEYLASNATGNKDPESNITVINVTRIPTVTGVEVLNTTISNVTIGIDVTNMTGIFVIEGTVTILDENGNIIDGLDAISLTDGRVNVTLPFDEAKEYRFIVHYDENDVYYASNATGNEDPETNITVIDVTKIPTRTNITILDTTYNNVTIRVNVTNMTGVNVDNGSVSIYDKDGNALVEGYRLTDGVADIHVPVTTTGEAYLVVEYDENDVYYSSMALNDSADKPWDEITIINVTKIPTRTTVEIISNLINNVTIGINVTNTTETPEFVANGEVVVYDTDGNELTRSQLTDGKANITIATSTDGIFEVVVKYVENDIYYSSVALNDSASPDKENITVINVEKIPTQTNVTVLNATVGNVTIQVNTTNMTGDSVTKGHVVVRDQNNNIIGEGELVNGGVNLSLNVTSPTQLHVNVTYLENDIYYLSNAKNNDTSHSISDENITIFNVTKQNPTITINITKDSVLVGEDVYIYGTVTDGMGKLIIEGTVIININGTEFESELADGLYSITNTTIKEGNYTINATYLGSQNINNITGQNINFTVNRMPTVTTVNILNNTAGNVTIEVIVTNSTGDIVRTGEVTVSDENGIIQTATIVDNKAIINLTATNTDEIRVNVSYVENTYYYSSNAVNSSQADPTLENVTVIDVVKQDATITIEVLNKTVLIGVTVTICGQVTDGMGYIIESGNVDVCVDGLIIPTTITDGYYTIENVTVTAGTFTVNATYKGNDMINSITSNDDTFTVNKIPTLTIVEILNTTVGNVTVDVKVTNKTGTAITNGELNITVAGKSTIIPVAGANTTIKLNVTAVGSNAVNVCYVENDVYNTSSGVDKDTIPSGGSPEDGKILENITVNIQQAVITVNATPSDVIVYQNVVINGTLYDGLNNTIKNAFVEVVINNTSYYTKTDANGVYTINYTPLYNGTVNVMAIYDGNTTLSGVNNTTSFTISKIDTITSVEILNTTLSNVTIKVTVQNNTDDSVDRGTIVVYDREGNELTKANLTDATAVIQIPCDKIGEFETVVKYLENDLYLNSTALNDTAQAGKENITLINVTRIPTTTKVEILDNIAGNVTLKVDVTNNTGEAVTKGTVYIHNATDYEQILASKDLTGGSATIKLDTIIESGLVEVIVEYQENDVYTASNATNKSAAGTPDENITVIDVQKQSVTISIELSDTSIIISENTIISGEVRDGMGEVVTSGEVTVYVIGEDTQTEKTVSITDNKYTLTYIATSAGNYTVRAKYLGNSSMTPVMSEDLTFTVDKIPTITNVEIINTTLSNVTIKVNVTNLTKENVIKGNITVKDTTGQILNQSNLDNGIITINIPVDKIGELRLVVTYNENNIYAESNATNRSAVGTPDENIIIIDVTRIPTVTSVEILNTTINNVTVDVKVTNMTGTGVNNGSVVITDTSGKILANGQLNSSHVVLNIPATAVGEYDVIVTYLENDVYLASNATNSSAKDTPKENITVINIIKLPTNTTVEILNTTLGNVTIAVNVTNMTGSPVNNGSIKVYDNSSNVIVDNTPLVNGKINITLPITTGGEHDIRVEYQENDYYYPSNATGNTPDKANITVINVTKIPTQTTVRVINNTAGNVTIGVRVTNMTNASVKEGVVIVKDAATKLPIVNKTLANGMANITIPVSDTDILKVIVEYQENDYYYPSNDTNSSATGSDENITVIDVVKQNATISISINNNSIIIGDTVTISGVVHDGLGNIVSEGQVLVNVNGINTVVNITDAKFTLEYTPDTIANYTANATYLGNDTVNNVTSRNINFTVGKIPTKTNVTIINTTVGNLTIQVNVTNITNSNVIKGNVTVYDMNGNSIVTGNLTGGLSNITIPSEHDGTVSVIVTYNENDLYLASNATNNSASGTPSEELIVINVTKQDAKITINLDKTNVTIGDSVHISGQITDGMGRPITEGTVTVSVDGDKYVANIADGKYEIDNITTKAGNVTVNATYNGKDGVINPATSQNVKLTVNKKQTQINVAQRGNTPGNTTLEVNVTDSQGNPVTGGNVTVTLPDGTTTTVPVVNGTALVPLNTTPGNTPVNITYTGTGEFDKANANTTVKSVKLNTTIPLDKIATTIIGDNITISGSLLDQNGNYIANADIKVKVNGKEYNTTTNRAGEYALSYTTTTSGVNNVSLEYLGNTIYNPTANKTTFTVNKKDTLLDVKQSNKTAGNTTLEVKVTDNEGRPVKNGSVIVTLPNGTTTTVPVVNGTAVVILNTTPGTTNVTITYNGTDEYNKASTNKTVTTDKINTTIPINNIKTVNVKDKVNITGKLLDTNNNVLPNINITVKVNNNTYTTKTNNKGEYNLQYTTTTGGVNNVTVSYPGNQTYNPTSNKTNFTVKLNATLSVKQLGNTVKNTTIQVNVTGDDGNKVTNGTVTVKDKDGNVIGTGVVRNGTANITLNVPAGQDNISVIYNGNDLYNPVNKTQSIRVYKNNATITINTIRNITFYQNAEISGKLTDINGNPIANAKITLNVDEVTKTVITDRYGDYKLIYNTTHVGLNNVTATFNGDDVYNPAKANATYNASKIRTYVTVADINGTIGDNITLYATVTDEYGTKVTGGQFVFKVNGLTLRTNGKFEAQGTPMILSPVNGTVTVTVLADITLRSAKNVTGVYGETSKYYGARSIIPGLANIAKRDAQITVTTVKSTKQDTNMTLTAKVIDVTHGKNNGVVYPYEDNSVIFKVNGITLKNEDGTAKTAQVVNGIATMDYYVPVGIAGTYTNLTNKIYTVDAVFASQEYYPNTRNNTTFTVERSPIHFNYTQTILNSQTKELTIAADILDYHDNLIIGKNTICLKINGQSYKVNNKTIYYQANDGKVEINIVLPYNVNKINSVELVTGQRVGYLGGRQMTTNITII